MRWFRYSAFVVGVSITLLAMGLAFFLLLLEFFGHQQHPYMAIITLGVLPVLGLAGLGIAALGLGLRRGAVHERLLPIVDLNQPGQRLKLMGVALAIGLVFCGSAFGSYQAYEYTDSVQFCGLTCHKVMQPEYSAHELSPHARVACVECHVGSGANWYVQSKVNGMHQLYCVLANKVPRPIGVPVKNLRPAQDTCENCHWTRQFYGDMRKEYHYFQSDDKNTPQQMVMLIHIGGDNPEQGPPRGIHWHMNISNEVTYATLDPKHQDIPWIQVRSKTDGRVRVYREVGSKVTDAQLATAQHRLMDCTECHNRPAHIFHTPDQQLDQALAQQRIDPTLPFIKQVAAEALEGTYQTQDDGVNGIATHIRKFYQDKHPEVLSNRGADVARAILAVQAIYRRNYFPEMKADWKAFPDHTDHMHATGCFRCHDDNHKSDDGKVLTKDCNLCHGIVAQTVGSKVQTDASGKLEFAHPGEGDGWKDNDCTDCHGPDAK